MPMHTTQRQIFDAGAKPTAEQQGITIGTVVDTNDPQEQGRFRVVCPKWGDSWNTRVEDLPWVMYASPFAGQTELDARGPGLQTSSGGIAYGMWAIPRVGTQVLVMCIDGNPMNRVYVGSLFNQFSQHTMPHGRFMYDDHPALPKTSSAPPYGPYTSTEHPIQPLSDNLERAYGGKSGHRYEFQTRGADYAVSSVDVSQLGFTYSKVADDDGAKYNNWTSTQGYQAKRIDSSTTQYESQVVAITSPGFHALSMDDRQENCRIRLRTTSGHQILMDDTNERIYVSTAEGNNWVEMDQSGSIDVYSTSNVSVHAGQDINFTADGTIRMTAKEGVHLSSGGDVRIKSGSNMHITANDCIVSTSTYSVNADTAQVNSSTLNLTGSSAVNVFSGGNVLVTGSTIQHTAGSHTTSVNIVRASTTPATAASSVAAQSPHVPSRVPQHEPWARTMTKSDTTSDPEFGYDDANVNRVERGRTINRGMFWRR